MRIDINFVMTPEAQEEAAKHPDMGSWQASELGTTPIQGDLVSFGGDDAPMFEVVNRLFMWKSHDHLVIQPLLGLANTAPPDQSSPGQTDS